MTVRRGNPTCKALTKKLNLMALRCNLGMEGKGASTLKGLNVNSPRCNLGMEGKGASTLKGLNVNSPRCNLNAIKLSSLIP